ncbi:ribose 5-phosphate isomerase [Cohnella kolymensis]|uniref:Ribose-5-phosphate isomerase A n=1 Tax=Cohnella kolymensis TaxID=1590652 RepID=A0ABR5A395_9BACL|nr:ribose-5-phosphate isomerase RpiA [Cohnella kolymensis]KIL35531.1 ribose 5-phosphate isomerase [Cohnella kolymensis]
MDAKQIAGEKAAEYVKDEMVVGLGTGSTVYWTIVKLGQLVKNGLKMKGVPTSTKTEELARSLGIPLIDINNAKKIDLAIDGADEVDAEFNLIKGGGGALLREKMIASLAERFLVVVDETKCVKTLGSFPLPVEIVPFGWQMTRNRIDGLGCESKLRTAGRAPYITDNGNFILDCGFDEIHDANGLNLELNRIPGVVENGLFVNMTDAIVIGRNRGKVEECLFCRERIQSSTHTK